MAKDNSKEIESSPFQADMKKKSNKKHKKSTAKTKSGPQTIAEDLTGRPSHEDANEGSKGKVASTKKKQRNKKDSKINQNKTSTSRQRLLQASDRANEQIDYNNEPTEPISTEATSTTNTSVKDVLASKTAPKKKDRGNGPNKKRRSRKKYGYNDKNNTTTTNNNNISTTEMGKKKRAKRNRKNLSDVGENTHHRHVDNEDDDGFSDDSYERPGAVSVGRAPAGDETGSVMITSENE